MLPPSFGHVKTAGMTACPPRIRSGAICELEPVTEGDVLRRGDIVLVKVKGTVYLHLITALERDRVQIGNNTVGSTVGRPEATCTAG